jgi:hypothetical protein
VEPRLIKRVNNDTSVSELLVKEYADSKHLAAQLDKRISDIKKELSEYTDTVGSTDEKGSKWITIGEFQLKRERRVSNYFDTAAAEAWVKEQGLWDTLKVTKEELDVDKLVGMAWTDPTVADVVASFYKEKETWAFKVIEGVSYDEE